MARPQKEGLDYFPLDTDIDQDDKVIVIIAKYGIEGFGILIKLLMEVYKNGYFYQWTEKEQLIFSSRVYVDINKVKELVNDCIKWGLFNQNIYEKHHVLTSSGIQKRYLLATSRRVNVEINEELRLVSVDINTNSTEKVSSKSTQSKVNKTKQNKTNNKIQFADTVFLTQQEYDRLVDEYGKRNVDDYIDRLDEWQTNNPNKKKKDHNKTLRNWMKDIRKKNNYGPGLTPNEVRQMSDDTQDDYILTDEEKQQRKKLAETVLAEVFL